MSTDPGRPFAHRLQPRPSLTAEAVTMARALVHLEPATERVIDDPWAELFLSPAGRRTRALQTRYAPRARAALDDSLYVLVAERLDR